MTDATARAAARESLLWLADLADQPVKLTDYASGDVFETMPASSHYIVTTDAQIFLGEFTHAEVTRVLAIVQHIPLEDEEMTAEVWMRAAWRQTNIYWATRRRIIRDARIRLRLTRPQRIGLMQLFLASLKLRRRMAERMAFEADEIMPLDVNVRDFDYVAEARDMPFEAVPNTSLRNHSLRDWTTALDLLVRAVSAVGDRAPRLVEYWDAIWSRFDEIISLVDEETPNDIDRTATAREEDADAAINPELDAIVATWMESLGLDSGESTMLQPAAVQASSILNADPYIMPRWDDAGASTRLGEDATPVVHKSARLRLSFCERCESIYYAHSTLLAAAKTYNLASAQSFTPLARQAYLRHFSVQAGAEVWSDFIKTLRSTDWDSLDRGFREGIVPKMAGAHLRRGAMEQYLLASMERTRARGSDIDLETIDTHFKASRVLSETDPEESGNMSRQWSSNTTLFGSVIGTAAAGRRLPGSRLAALVLLVLVEQSMRLKACPESLLLITGRHRAAFIDELEEESIIPSFPPITPWEMTIRSGRTCCLVILMQRYYVVLCADLTKPRVVLELPSLPSAVLAWFVFHPSELEPFMHPSVYGRIHEIQTLL